MTPYDLIIIGADPAAANAAALARQTGWSVLSVEGGARFVDRHIIEVDGVRHEARKILVTTDSSPPLDALNLPCAQIETADGRVLLDEQLRSVSNPAVYFAADLFNSVRNLVQS
jgi:pyruvate/2-oxoglutarate dehydrogenase complex dihydrolipoamide dehydrogenase (E3) component